MTKNDLAKSLAFHTGISVQQATDEIEVLMGILTNAFINGDSLYLRGFGTFRCVTLKARSARNITANELIQVPETRTVKFKPVASLKKAMNA